MTGILRKPRTRLDPEFETGGVCVEAPKRPTPRPQPTRVIKTL
jgi:hypothetical protein